MEKSAPAYPGPPGNYGEAMPPQGMYPQPGMYAEPGFSVHPAGPPPVGYQGGVTGVQVAPTPVIQVTTPGLQDVPGNISCPNCQQSVLTEVESTPGLMTWGVCACLAFFGCFLCCCIPFCVNSCQNTTHRCPICRNVVYLHKRC